ncbi:hypothetical protein WA158_006809 [Blastocystis sp. Blastoise]
MDIDKEQNNEIDTLRQSTDAIEQINQKLEANSTDSGILPHIIITFDEAIKRGTDGMVICESYFGDLYKVGFGDETYISISNNTLDVHFSDSLLYGTQYYVYFDGKPIVSSVTDKVAVLTKGEYSFSTLAKDNIPMIIGLASGMCLMLALILITYFILKCIIKKKAANGTLPKLNSSN